MNSRRGMLLMVIAQLMIVIIVMTMSYILVMRQDGTDSAEIIKEAQSRIMMHAALMYIQEGSRLGWAHNLDDPNTNTHAASYGWPATVGLAYGWTDSRDGSLGPRGPRPLRAGPDSDDIPAPSWWTFSTPYQPFPEDSDLPPVAERRWPCPGSATRATLEVAELPPYATDGRYNYNPIRRGDRDGPQPWPFPRGPEFYPLAALDPQPQADRWQDFKQGLTTSITSQGNSVQASLPENKFVLRSHTVGKSWFRIYRENLEDHDANGFATQIDESGERTVQWPFDSVALYDPNYPQLKNWNVFIISCGAGGSRGYRWWDMPSNDPRRALEPITAKESGFFSSETEFKRLQEDEYIMWFRVHWSPLNGGYANMRMVRSHVSMGGIGVLLHWKKAEVNGSDSTNSRGNAIVRTHVISSQGGNFQFIQRLPTAPPNW